MDIYWAVNGGADPVALLARYPGRFKMLHVKDSTGPPDHKMADVGAGTIDFKTIFARAHGNRALLRRTRLSGRRDRERDGELRYLSAVEF